MCCCRVIWRFRGWGEMIVGWGFIYLWILDIGGRDFLCLGGGGYLDFFCLFYGVLM